MKRIAFFIPFQGCTRRCIYCDQSAITGVSSDTPVLSPETVGTVVSRQTQPIELCFFGGSFARQDRKRIAQYLNTIRQAPIGSRVTFSSYPGDFEGESGRLLIDELKQYPVGTIELGIPSLDPQVLQTCRRNDDPARIRNTVAALSDTGFHIGVQLMIGLPGQSFESSHRDLETLSALKKEDTQWDLRIYPCLVLRGTLLAEMYAQKTYCPLTLDEAVKHTGQLLHRAKRHNFTPIRIGLLESNSLREAIIAGPYHPAFGELALSETLVLTLLQQSATGPWFVDKSRISWLTGHAGRGIKRISEIAELPHEIVRKSIRISDKQKRTSAPI